TRKLLAGLAIVPFVLFLVGGTAVAEPRGKAEEECIKLLEEGKKIEKCQEAPNPILPAGDELFWAIVSFTVLAIVLWKFAWPGLRNGMEARSDRIRQSIED